MNALILSAQTADRLLQNIPVLSALSALALCFALHIYAIAAAKELLRRITKALLVPLVAAAHIAIAGFAFPFVLLALFFGWIGDLLLIPSDSKLMFGMGAFSFLIGHICYITAAFLAFWPQLSLQRLPLVLSIVPGAVMLLFLIFAYLTLRKKLDKKDRLPILVYMTGISTMAFVMLLSAVGEPCFPKILAAVGALLFTVSDFVLESSMIGVIKCRNSNLPVMLTYVPAQAFIALGFALSI